MKGIILKTTLALCLSTGVTTAMAQTEQPEILKKDPSQQQPTKETPPSNAGEGATGGDGMEAPINPSEQAPAEQQQAPSQNQPAGEQGGSGTMKSGEQKGSEQPAGQGAQGTQGTTTDQKADRPKTEGSGEPKSEPGSDTTQQSQPSGKSSTTVNVTAEQKTEITQVIRETKVAPARDIDVEISVGVAIPRTIEVHRLPPRIIRIVPDYEGYVYFVLDDGRIVILDPDTYEVVAVLA
ncbi:DUF1236 domain-containing protein [Mesorhizobium sp. 1M-11]|uniref:DUF1236 domain-containing protein n=1 Tax=Mesorhizobium sp. 1M-11 TaxID=1529006 RepID=UPI0006C76F59|nr:DUF1236 domain-containing protein [Mesorhizobium sp. 1M-11]